MTATTGARAPEHRTLRPRPSAAERIAGSLPRTWLVVAAVLPLLLLAGWAGLLLARDSGARGASIGSQAPEFSLADLDGDPVRLADLRGRPVIVNFWASWCGPCVEEFPLLSEAATRHAGDGLALVGIVFRDNSEAARAFMQRMGASWPAAMDPGEATAQEYGIYGPPETFFIDAEGTVVARQIGPLGRADLERHLATLLGKE
ncbi:MAG TPA: TlpA disulfide reductase family protein [Candidatus Limnocylindria bacterium]|nr:TlpA disulfide reductase family protein [Candidatus Limnocylindria bacterium]